MISFYPGPSQVYPQVAQYLQDAFDSGILSVNHRSGAAMELVRETYQLLHEKLDIPADYAIAFVSSATECWEIIAQSLTTRQSLHAYNGAFGQKWAEYTQKLGLNVVHQPFGLNEVLSLTTEAETICLTQNETSNGTQVKNSTLRKIREAVPNALLAVDATSSMAGIAFDWTAADVWFASVQKCFGLPAGMGLLVYGPGAVERARTINERNHYNSLLFIDENVRKFQTHYTPNVLNIYLLKRVLEQVPPIQTVAAALQQRAQSLATFFEKETSWQLLVANAAVRSDTVLAITGTIPQIEQIKQTAKARQITLGNGYGDWKETTFRIANFPAINDTDFTTLRAFLTEA